MRNKAALREKFDAKSLEALKAAATAVWPLPVQLPQGIQVTRSDESGEVTVAVSDRVPIEDVAAAVRNVASAVAKSASDDADMEDPDATVETAKAAVASCAADAARLFQQCQALFEWQDGPLVTSMRRGDIFLLDELSLAEDAVLERLNSVLEPSRSLLLVRDPRPLTRPRRRTPCVSPDVWLTLCCRVADLTVWCSLTGGEGWCQH